MPGPHLYTHFKTYIRHGANLDVFPFRISNSKTVFLKLVQANLVTLKNRANWENWAECHEIFNSPNSVCRDMSWLLNALFVIVRSERDISATILVTKFTCMERLQEVTLISSKYLGTLLPIILSGDRLQFLMPGPDKNESRQRFELFGSRKTVNENSLELEHKRQQTV